MFYFVAEFPEAVPLGLKKGTLAGILAGTIIGAIAVSVVATFFIMRRRSKRRIVSRPSSKSLYLFSKHSLSFHDEILQALKTFVNVCHKKNRFFLNKRKNRFVAVHCSLRFLIYAAFSP